MNSGEVIRISTGAAVPEGADAVVQVEDTCLIEATEDGSKELQIEIIFAPKALQDIRFVDEKKNYFSIDKTFINFYDLG